MSLKSRIIELVIRGKNLFSKPADEATESTEALASASKALKEELKHLEKQDGLIAAYKSQQQTLQALTQEQAQYEAQIKGLQQAERESGALTDEQARNLKELQAAVKLTEKEIRSATRSLDSKSGALRRAGLETDKLDAAEAQLSSQIKQSRSELARTNQQLASNIAAHRAAEASTKKHGDSVDKAGGQVNGFTTKIKVATGQVLALIGAYAGFDALIRVGHNFMQASTEMENLTARAKNAYKDLDIAKGAMVEFQKIAVTTPFSLEAVTDAALKLKAFGLDPLDGSLRSIIDQSSAMGVSQENLEGIILAVGQAWAKQKLQGEEILQLVERGVPVWDMLGRVLNKTTGEVQKLSEQGRLGRAEIRLLVEEMGRANMGAAAENINNMSGSWSNFNDKVREVYRTLGEQGAWNYLTQQVQLATKWFDQMLQSGQVAEWGKSLNSALQSVGESVKSLTSWINENSGAIANLIKTYAGIKIAAFFYDGAKAAGQLAKSIRGTSEETSALKKAWDLTSKGFGIGAAIAVGALRGLLAVIQTVTAAMRTMRVASMLMFGPLVAAVTVALDVLWKLGEQFLATKKSADALKESQAVGAEQARKMAEVYKEYSEQTGIAITSMDEYNRMIADGTLIVDEFSGKLMSAAQYQEALASRSRKSMQEVAESMGGMSAEGAKLTAQMQQMKEAGRSTSEMVDSLFASLKKDGEFSATDAQIKSVVEALAAMERQGYSTGTALEKEIKKQLSDLSGNELLRFRKAGEGAFTAVAGASENTARAINESTGDAFRRLGIDMDALRGKSTDMGRDMSASLNTIAMDAESTREEMLLAANAAIEMAKSSGDIQLLEEAIRKLGETGKLTKADIVELMDKSKDKSKELTDDVKGVSAALERLGVVTLKTLQQNAAQAGKDYKVLMNQISAGKVPQNEAIDGFLKMAESQIKLAHAQGQVIPAWLREQAVAMQVTKQFDELAGKYQETAAASGTLKLAADDLVDSLNANTTAVEQNTDATERMADACEVSGGMVGQLTAGLSEQRAELEALGPAVAAYYDQLQYGSDIQAQATENERKLAEARAEQQRQFENWGGVTVSGLDSVRESYYNAARAQTAFWEQKVSAERLQNQLATTNNLTESMIRSAEQSARSFELLDDSSLSGLHAAIDAARSKMEQLRQSADQTLSSLEQRLANLNGDTVAATALQMEQERQRLQEQLDQARTAGDDETIRKLQQALSLHSQITREEMTRARQQDDERKKQAKERTAEANQAKSMAADAPQTSATRTVSESSAPSRTEIETVKLVEVRITDQVGQTAQAYTRPGTEGDLLAMLKNARGNAF
ncbi:tape measure protein [Plesiomonas shigelloides]|uniref:tape measure protein n=2 Tax=Bacteria TaxID=2 RepID=UPI00387F11D5